jgi:hypothetical protein
MVVIDKAELPHVQGFLIYLFFPERAENNMATKTDGIIQTYSHIQERVKKET